MQNRRGLTCAGQSPFSMSLCSMPQPQPPRRGASITRRAPCKGIHPVRPPAWESRGPKALRGSPEGSALWWGIPRHASAIVKPRRSRQPQPPRRGASITRRDPCKGTHPAQPSSLGVERAEGPSRESRGQRPLAGFPKGQRPFGPVIVRNMFRGCTGE